MLVDDGKGQVMLVSDISLYAVIDNRKHTYQVHTGKHTQGTLPVLKVLNGQRDSTLWLQKICRVTRQASCVEANQVASGRNHD